jgi:hypothetical protein
MPITTVLSDSYSLSFRGADRRREIWIGTLPNRPLHRRFMHFLAKNITKARKCEDTKVRRHERKPKLRFFIQFFFAISFLRAFVMRSPRFGSGSAGLGEIVQLRYNE